MATLDFRGGPSRLTSTGQLLNLQHHESFASIVGVHQIDAATPWK